MIRWHYKKMTRRQILALAAAPLYAETEPGFVNLFDGRSLNGWFLVNKQGPGFLAQDGKLVCPIDGGQKLMTERQYANFVFRFSFLLQPDGNNGIGIRAPRDGHTATLGMEIQILDQSGPKYGPMKLKPEQYHGSIYSVVPARTGFLKKPGEWNDQEILAAGRRIKVTLNGTNILDVNLDMINDAETLKKHPGLARKSGHIALLGHGSHIQFRDLRLKELPA
jgi:hypothetical protein